MAIHDYSIANQSHAAFRSDLNNALSAIKSSNSGTTAPSTPVAGELWYDTTASLFKVYNGSAFEEIKSGDIVAADLTNNSVTTSKILDSAVTASKLSVTGNGSSGQMLTSNAAGGFNWTSLAAGTGIDLSGATFSIESDLRDNVQYVGTGTDDFIHIDSDKIRFYVNSSEIVRMESDGDLHCDGSVVAYSATVSDRNLKTAISNVDNALTKVLQLNGVEFTRKDTGVRSAGVIAQEVEKVLPQAVVERKLPLQTGTDEMYKTVEYDALHSLYIEAIKELKQQLDDQALEIKELKKG